MNNKEIQEQRMKGYFIESAKNLLRGEGLKSISVRHVADHAGYSYATLYNYFKDLNELIFICVEDFQKEAAEFIERKSADAPRGIGKLNAIARAYAEYFIEYPGVFELFFVEKMTDSKSESKCRVSELIHTFLDRLCEKEWDHCVESGVFTRRHADIRKQTLNNAVTGMLLFYERRTQPANYEDFIASVKEQTAAILS